MNSESVNPEPSHFTLRPGFAILVGFLVLTLYILGAAYGAAPTSLRFLAETPTQHEAVTPMAGMEMGGLFGWIRLLPWNNPVMVAIGFATVNLALGGVFSMVLIQEKIAILLSDTLFVPGYFHFLTVGSISLTFIAALIYVIPSLTGHLCWRPNVLARLIAPFIAPIITSPQRAVAKVTFRTVPAILAEPSGLSAGGSIERLSFNLSAFLEAPLRLFQSNCRPQSIHPKC
jgi:hypothetical protein